MDFDTFRAYFNCHPQWREGAWFTRHGHWIAVQVAEQISGLTRGQPAFAGKFVRNRAAPSGWDYEVTGVEPVCAPNWLTCVALRRILTTLSDAQGHPDAEKVQMMRELDRNECLKDGATPDPSIGILNTFNRMRMGFMSPVPVRQSTVEPELRVSRVEIELH